MRYNSSHQRPGQNQRHSLRVCLEKDWIGCHFAAAKSQSAIDAFYPSRIDYEAGEQVRAPVVPGIETIEFLPCVARRTAL